MAWRGVDPAQRDTRPMYLTNISSMAQYTSHTSSMAQHTSQMLQAKYCRITMVHVTLRRMVLIEPMQLMCMYVHASQDGVHRSGWRL